MVRSLALTVLGAVLGALLACSPSPGPSDGGGRDRDAGSDPVDGGTDARLVVGTGSVDFEPIAPGGEVRLERGFQGGYHVWGALRVRDVEPDDVEFRFELELDDGVLAETGFVTDLWAATDGSDRAELAGITVFVVEEEPQARDGAVGTFRARVEDRTGVVVTGQVEVVVRCCELDVGGPPDGGVGGPLDAGVVEGGGLPPVINGFVQEPLSGRAGIPLSIAVIADDPEGAELGYQWTADEGELSSPTQAGLAWTVSAPGDYDIHVTVSDGVLETSARTTVTFE